MYIHLIRFGFVFRSMASGLQFPLALPELSTSPLLSVIMPSYNYEQYIEEAIWSVVNQSYSNWELVICDDGSTDSSLEVAQQIAQKESRISILKQANAGVSAALNTAYSVCKGEIVCLLDADDMFDTGKLMEVVHRCQADVRSGFVLHGMRVIDHVGKELYTLPRAGRFEEGWLADDVVRRGGRWRSMPASALSFRREIADLLFPLPVDKLKSMADAYLYMLAPLLTETSYIDKPLAEYRLHGQNMTGTLTFDVPTAEKFMQGMERVHESIEAKACPALFDTMPLQLTNHLTYQEQSFLKSLFGHTPRAELLFGYARLLRLINQDDLYGSGRKWMGMIANGIAIGLPASWRRHWVSWVMGAKWRRWLIK